jgi:hypothetical protein
MPSMGHNRPQYTYTYTPALDNGPRYWRIGFWVLFSPVVVVLNAGYEAALAIRCYALGVGAGLGIGTDADPVIPRRPVEKWQGAREPAYVQYLFGPVWRDVKHTLVVALRKQRAGGEAELKRIARRHFIPPEPDATEDRRNPTVGIALVVGMALGFLLAGILLLIAFVAQAVALAVLWAGGLALIYILRAADSVLLLVRGIRITCPNPDCFHHVAYPSYQCPECGVIQYDVRPGRYGMLHRVCRCGHRMPTLLMLGSHRMKGFCPRCGKELEESAGSSREIILPVFGSAVAGKSQFLAAVAVGIRQLLDRGGGAVEPADDFTRTWYRHVLDMYSRGGTVTKTPPGYQHANSLRLTVGGGVRVLKMFDAAGEVFRNPERIRDLLYLRAHATFVFVLDPLSVPALWASIDADRQRKLAPIRAATSPEAVFEETVQTLHEMRVPTRAARLAVIVSKADLIRPEIDAARVGPDDSIQAWLDGPLQAGNLVRAIGHEFGTVRYFLTDARLGGSAVSPSIESFVTWVLANEGVKP